MLAADLSEVIEPGFEHFRSAKKALKLRIQGDAKTFSRRKICAKTGRKGFFLRAVSVNGSAMAVFPARHFSPEAEAGLFKSLSPFADFGRTSAKNKGSVAAFSDPVLMISHPRSCGEKTAVFDTFPYAPIAKAGTRPSVYPLAASPLLFLLISRPRWACPLPPRPGSHPSPRR